jgi:hypothetical protein
MFAFPSQKQEKRVRFCRKTAGRIHRFSVYEKRVRFSYTIIDVGEQPEEFQISLWGHYGRI